MKPLVVLCCVMSVLSGFTIEIPLTTIDYTFERQNGYDRICIDGVCVHPFDPGMPDIPAVTYTYVIPKNQIVTDIEVVEAVWQEVRGNFSIFPRQHDIALNEERTFTEPDSAVYHSQVRIPAEPVLSYDCGVIRGYRICQITVAPFSYTPAMQQLYCLKRLTIRMQTRIVDIPVAPKRESNFSHNAFFDLLSHTVVNDGDLFNDQYRPQTTIQVYDGDSMPTDLPSLIGPPVDLIIITDGSQYDAYQTYVPVKKKMGMNTVVKTISWVRQNYNGIDNAERIRRFITDAMVQWGTSYVILGGDHEYVPTRFVWVDRSIIYTQLWLPFSSDLYYSDLDGSWNFDGDDKFGEVADSLDLYSDMFIGRIPTRNSDDVLAFLDKVMLYTFPANTTYQEKALFFSSNLQSNWPGLPWAYEMSEHIPSCFTRSFLDETLGNLSIGTLRDSIHSGFGLIAGVGHGDVNIMCIKYAWPRVYIDNHFYDALHNSPCNGLLVVVTCYTNPFQSNCLGEHWVRNPDGGGIAYIGPTSSSEGSIHKEYMKCLLDSTFSTPLGAALVYGKINYVGNAQWNNWHRVHQLSLTLLGDPTLSIWGRHPVELKPATVIPDTLTVGYDTLFITYDPHNKPVPIHGTFYKENDIYTTDSSTTNTFITPIKSTLPGFCTFTLNAVDHIPYQDSVYIAPGGPFCTTSGITVVDSAHNGNGVINPGETIWLTTRITNTGGSTAMAVSGLLVCTDTFVTMISDTSAFPNVLPGELAENIDPFVFSIDNTIPDDHGINFELIITYDGSSAQDTFQIVSQAPTLAYFRNSYRVTGDSVTIMPFVANYGHASAHGVDAVLRSLSDSIIVLDSTVVFPVIAPNTIVSSEPDSFVIVRESPTCSIYLDVRISMNGLEQFSQSVVYETVPAVDSLRVYGGKQAIRLKWKELSAMRGYRVYRALQDSGPYAFLGNNLEPAALFEDFTVQPDQHYYYYVQAVDSSMNEGVSLDTVATQINPAYAAGWPQDVYGLLYGSPNFGDIDPFYPGLEVVTASLDGSIYAWHYDGTPVNGSDPRLFDSGSDYIWASPAIGDIDGDGSYEIVFGVMRGSNNLYAIRYNPLDSQVVVLPGWPKSCQGGGFASSPILADIDEDADLEIVALASFPAHLYVFHHDGSAVFHNKSGLLKELYGDILGTPAVGDLDNDGLLEIVCCGGHQSDSLFVWKNNGQYMDPFPAQVNYGMGNGVVVGDVVGSRDLEICFYSGGPSFRLSLVDIDGMTVWEYPAIAEYIELSPALGDVTGDGRAEVILGYNDGLDAGLMVFDSIGTLLPGFPVKGHDAYPPAIVDIDDNGLCDIVCGSTEWNIYAYDMSGTMVSGYPIMLGNRINSTPAVYDIDQDGTLELMVSCYDLAFHVFDLDATESQWPRFHYDPHNSGCYTSGYYHVNETPPVVDSIYPRVRIFPTPFIHGCVIQWSGNTQSAGASLHISIYDIAGRMVYEKRNLCGDKAQTIVWGGDDVRGRSAPCGIYFVAVEHMDHTSVQKVIKVK